MPTKRGWSAVASGLGLWVLARFIGSPDLHMVAVGILALPVLATVFVHWNRVRIEVHRHLSSVRVFPRSRVAVTLTVDNRGPGTAPFLLLEDKVPPELGKSARLVVTGVPSRNQQAVSYSVTCRLRGRFRLGPATIQMTDPFGLARASIETAQTNDLIVFPEVEHIEAAGLAVQGAGMGESAVRHLYRQAAEFYTMREYNTGDDLRRIHWPSVARTGQLMIRQDESTRRSEATVFVDNRHGTLGAGGSPGFERAVSTAATVGSALVRAGFAVRLAAVDMAPNKLTEQGLLEALAGIAPTRTKSLADPLRALRSSLQFDSTLVVVSAPLSPGEVAAASRLGAGMGRKVAVLVYPVNPSTLPTSAAAELESRATVARVSLQRAGWNVYVIGPDGRLAEIWKQSASRKLRQAASSS
jgi:uncharacterized protein (DUF58 family)